MINPSDITNYNRTPAELEEFLMFCIMVAGKNSKMQASKLDGFLKTKQILGHDTMSPFEFIEYLTEGGMVALDNLMRFHKLGQYGRIARAFTDILRFKGRLDTVTVEELESVYGIGAKSARFFLLHSRPNQRLVVLDTHLLRHMRDLGFKAPKSTPPKKTYAKLEGELLKIIDNSGKTPAQYDLDVWKSSSAA